MSKHHQPNREYTQAEQQGSFLQRRYEAFTDRSRDPGDAVTWAVVLGALMCALLIVSLAVAEERRLILPTLILLAVWIFVVTWFGKVNILSVLWGASVADAKTPPQPVFVLLPTLVLTLFAFVATIVDAATGWDFRWYGLALGATSIWYLILFLRTLLASREGHERSIR